MSQASVSISAAIPNNESIHQGVSQCFTANVALPDGWHVNKYTWIRQYDSKEVYSSATDNKFVFQTSKDASGVYDGENSEGVTYSVFVEVESSDGTKKEIQSSIHQSSASNHVLSSKVVIPTCTDEGYTLKTCTQWAKSYDGGDVKYRQCNFSEKTDVKPALGHEAGTEWKHDDTHHWHECVRNDAEMDKAEHVFGDWTTAVPATCTEKGSESRTCVTCDYTETREIPAKDHTYPETYAYDGTAHWQVCTVCGKETEKVAHTFDNWTVVTEPTATETGLKERACTVCGAKQSEDIPAKGEDVKPQPGKTFTVTFDDLLADTENQTVSVKEGGTVAKPAQDPVLDGYRFDGWYLWNKQDGFGETAFDFSTPVTEDFTLYAKWSKLGDNPADNQGGNENNGNGSQNQDGSSKGDGNVTGVGGAVGDNEQSDNTATDKKADEKQKDGNALPQTGDPMSIAALAGIAASGAGFVAAGSAIARKRR